MFPTHEIDRFFSLVDKTDDCWIFKSSKRNGYGRMMINGILYFAHRLSWMIHNGPIGEGKIVCHKCDNRMCVNPAHLYVGTYSDNMSDRQNRISIPNIGRQKTFSIEVISEVIKLYKEGGWTYRDLSAKFGMSQATISAYMKGKR